MIKKFAAAIAAAAVALLGAAAPAAQAAPKPPPSSMPFTCGMEVYISTNVHLDRDLTCSGDGLRAPSSSTTTPVNINIDLRGHTLSGPGAFVNSGVAISGPGYSTPVNVTVTNGTITNWDIAVGGFNLSTKLTKVKLINNRAALSCTGGTCTLDNSTITSTAIGTQFGVGVGESGNLVVQGSTLSNLALAIGATSGGGTVKVQNSTFTGNKIGIDSNVLSSVAVADSTFTKNGIAIRVYNAEYIRCGQVSITNVKFRSNGADVVRLDSAGNPYTGPVCGGR